MLFQVIRTSMWEEEKPYDKCIPIKTNAKYPNSWGIEINSLEELMDFKRDVGSKLVINQSYIDKQLPMIEIYDDYRE